MKIKINKELQKKCKSASEKLGCSSVEEFVTRILERETDKIISQTEGKQENTKNEEAIKNRLKGLGYID